MQCYVIHDENTRSECDSSTMVSGHLPLRERITGSAQIRCHISQSWSCAVAMFSEASPTPQPWSKTGDARLRRISVVSISRGGRCCSGSFGMGGLTMRPTTHNTTPSTFETCRLQQLGLALAVESSSLLPCFECSKGGTHTRFWHWWRAPKRCRSPGQLKQAHKGYVASC